jgi:hypothetical protein
MTTHTITFNEDESPEDILNCIFNHLVDIGFEFAYKPINYPNAFDHLMLQNPVCNRRNLWNNTAHASGKMRLVCTRGIRKKTPMELLEEVFDRNPVGPLARKAIVNFFRKHIKEEE